ncbi:class I SAM-dependent methyltransferase [Robertmurraya kyonggiensis]|uniref:Class I SAM-dependent methyltransferase n=1 Tax=Robertmurraya kyonggiensis TaxID=1037680 RepID=A0A4U1D9Y0_9BACI|nr:class I SAM-dependent methyltransferase [Robertmurraya kyonggiensis]TKC18823.1 class I SAM-dependent methyltransferase [Robertmurraya kyonggiensis]
MKEFIKQAYNELSDDYEHNVDTQSAYNIYYERPAMIKLLPDDLKNKKVLDAGCAAGWYTEQFIEMGADVAAVDMSPEMVEATKRRVGEKAEVLCCDLEGKLPFADESFDLIVSSLVLHYVGDWKQTFAEFQRILKLDGTFIFSVHHPMMDIHLSEEKEYFSTELIIDTWKRQGELIKVPFYRRPLQSILNETVLYFSLKKIVEPQPVDECKEKAPESYERLMKNPQFLIIKAQKP